MTCQNMPVSSSWNLCTSSMVCFSMAWMPRYSLYSCSSIRSSTSTMATMNQPMARSQKLGLQPVTGSAQYIWRLSS